MQKRYIIYLTDEERDFLNQVIETCTGTAVTRAKILLASDYNNPVYQTASDIAEELDVSRTTVQNVRNKYSASGIKDAILSTGTWSPERCANITEEKRKQILDMIKEKPPYGHRRWSINVVAEECEKRGLFDHIAPSAIYKLLKEENISLLNK